MTSSAATSPTMKMSLLSNSIASWATSGLLSPEDYREEQITR
nr:hypothetical protein Iba_chr14dCG11620 [Ipomoea batatas]